jgi:hypothetical protein
MLTRYRRINGNDILRGNSTKHRELRNEEKQNRTDFERIRQGSRTGVKENYVSAP